MLKFGPRTPVGPQYTIILGSKALVIMQRIVVLLLCFFISICLQGQVLGYVDSVEVHRTDTIYFAFGSAELTETGLQAVTSLAEDRPDALELYLEGHTDAVGSNAANDRLAQRRSEAALRAAQSAGWPTEFIEIRHFGERQLEVNTEEREWRNRRVLLRSGKPRRYARFRGLITDQEGNPLPGAAIAQSRYLKDSVRADSKGYYELMLPMDIGVRLDVYAENHFFKSEVLVLSENKPGPPLVSKLQPAVEGGKMAIDDLYFVGNQTNLLRESYPVLPRLLLFLRSSPGLHVEIAGHVNMPGEPQGPGTWSYNLANSRARFIYDFLVEAGIPSDRLSYKGYSNMEMVNPTAKTEIAMRANRRVEIRVTKIVGKAEETN